MIGLIVYIVGFLLTFFAASIAVARCCPFDDPTDPDIFLLIAGLSFIWPLTLSVAAVGFLLFGIARLAEYLANK